MEEEKKHVLDWFRRIGGTTPNQVSPQKPFKKTSFHKCVDSSVKYRNMGNKVFREPRHDAKSHMQIWRFYSYSIAHAPPGSDHLALGYANRSALLLHLRKFEECIRDVDRTLKITKCCELKAKLLCRKTECLVALQDGG
ncbi:SET and MYND domain-containing protein 4-like [Copidosoma floridanum]|uniref:SET and MYND domain-containing protein 4-like n=1 Tax=Copidosoma floridanum TaxID=29053 RepID=UPI0006C99FF7|nr:SET and MYND domain-containing protein 4-like [Copidosoma floridanum]